MISLKIFGKKKEDLIVLILCIILGIFFFKIGSSNDFFGDAATQVWISKSIWEKGNIISNFNFITSSEGTKMLITYPLLFHVSLSLSNILPISNHFSIYIFSTIFSMFFILSFYILVKYLFDKITALVSVIFLMFSSQLFTLSTVVFMETFVFAFLILGLLYLLKFSEKKQSKFLYLSFFFISISVSAKQSTLLFLIAIILWILIRQKNNIKNIFENYAVLYNRNSKPMRFQIRTKYIDFKKFLIFLSVVGFVIVPVYFQISTTGTISTPPDRPPMEWLLQHKWSEDKKSNEFIKSSFEQENLVDFLLKDYKRIYRFFYPFDINTTNFISDGGGIFFILIIFGIIFLIKEKRPLSLFILILFIIYSFFILNITANPRYYIPAFLIVLLISILGIKNINRISGKKKSILILFLLVILSFTNLAKNIEYEDNPSYPYIGTGYPNLNDRIAFIEASNWVKSNNLTGIFLAGRWKEVMLYSNVTVTWISPFGGSEFIEMFNTSNSTMIEDILKSYNVSYVFITKDQLSDKGGDVYYVTKSFYKILKESEIVFKNGYVEIYQIKDF